MFYTIYKENCKEKEYPIAEIEEIFKLADRGTKIAKIKMKEKMVFHKRRDMLWVENPTLINVKDLWEISTLKNLIKAGADVHYNDDFLLRYASIKKKNDIVKYLISAGANIHADNDFVIFNTSNQGNVDLLKYFEKCGIDIKYIQNEMLQLAANNNQRIVMQFLLENGADIHCNEDWIYKNVKHEGTISFAEIVCSYA